MSESAKTGQPKKSRHDIIYKGLVEKALKLRQQTFEAFVELGEAHLGGSFSMEPLIKASQVAGSTGEFVVGEC